MDGRQGRTDGAHLERRQRLLVIGSFVAAAAVLATIAIALWQSRNEAWDRAHLAQTNLTRAIATHVERHIRKYDAAIALVTQELRDPAFDAIPPGFLPRMLANIAGGADHVGSILILDPRGDIVADSAIQPRVANFADRDYFKVHQAGADIGTYISQPYQSRLRSADWSIALSRRFVRPDGSFGGVALIAVRLEFVRTLMRMMELDPKDVMVLLNDQGRVLMRQPSANGGGDIGLDLSASPNFRRIRSEGTGSFTAVATIDGVERMYSFTRVDGSNLIVNVGIATEPILAAWRSRSLVIGAMAGFISAALVALALLLRRELFQRAQAEAALELLATTDGLTSLANRRRFDEVLEREWRRIVRTNSLLSVILIDADHFKQLNDRHGHAVGDEMLKLLASTIGSSAHRPGDLAARIGGEEFAVILADTGSDGAEFIAEKIRTALTKASLPLRHATLPASTVSIGIATTLGKEAGSAAALLEAADKAVYAAKRAGRNRVMRGHPGLQNAGAAPLPVDAPPTRH